MSRRKKIEGFKSAWNENMIFEFILNQEVSDYASLTFYRKDGGGSPKISGAFNIWILEVCWVKILSLRK